MTNERAREVAEKILADACGEGSPHYRVSEAEATALAYRDEVRREVLGEAIAQLVNEKTGQPNQTSDFGRGFFRAMESIGDMMRSLPIVKPSSRPPTHDADRDFVLRTLAQAYVGNDYTIEGRKFQAAVGRLWPR